MFEDRIRDLCLELGYESTEFLLSSQGETGISVQACSSDGRLVVIRFTTLRTGVTGTSKVFEPQRWKTGNYSTGYVTDSQKEGSGSEVDEGHLILEEMRLRWGIGVMADNRHVNPIFGFGRIKNYLYEIRPYYAVTLHHLIEKQMSPSHAVLFRVVDQIWAALAFLHQSEVNQPHGALSTHNVGFLSNRLIEEEASLLDLKETVEPRRAEFKRQDFQDLGMLIYQFASSLEKPVDAVDAAMRCQNASWNHLGAKEKNWKALTSRLLNLDSFPFGYDLAGAREQLLESLLPSKTSFTVFLNPKPVNTEAPYHSGSEEDADTKPIVDYQHEIERLIEAGDHLLALKVLLSVPNDFEPQSQILIWGDIIADSASGELSDDTEFLSGIENLANRGSTRASLRLGQALSKNQPVEALSWLKAASDAGLSESYILLAEIHEHGGEGVDENPAKALEFYQASLEFHDSADWNVAYRMAALILRETSLAGRLPLAIEVLENCHVNWHYRSIDLLAQCHAQGLGVESDEKKAFELFVEAWNRSKKCNENYYTASNNLGVCFAIGFGTRKDPTMARHYFKQGEIAGHEASKKNLHALAQSD